MVPPWALTAVELRMPNAELARIAGRAKFDPADVSVKVRLSTLVNVIAPMIDAVGPDSPFARSRVKRTSSVVTGVPSEKRSPLRRRRVSQRHSCVSIAPLRSNWRVGSRVEWSKTAPTTSGAEGVAGAVAVPGVVSGAPPDVVAEESGPADPAVQ